MLQRWEGNASRAEAVDGRAEVILLTLEILLRSMFSGDLIGSEQVLRDAILDCSRHMDLVGAVKIVKLLTWFRFAKRRRFQRAIRTLDDFILRVVEERRRNQVDNGDLVSLLLWARDEQTGESMTDRQVRDELMTMLQAGNDTVADAISWTWYLLAKHPEARERVELEVDSALRGRAPGFEDLPALEYTHRVITEAMRIYPSAWVFARSAVKDDVIGGYRYSGRGTRHHEPIRDTPATWPMGGSGEIRSRSLPAGEVAGATAVCLLSFQCGAAAVYWGQYCHDGGANDHRHGRAAVPAFGAGRLLAWTQTSHQPDRGLCHSAHARRPPVSLSKPHPDVNSAARFVILRYGMQRCYIDSELLKFKLSVEEKGEQTRGVLWRTRCT